MEQRLDDIVEDLYRLDPALREESKAVRTVVETLLQKKPNFAPDPRFVADLRQLIMARAQQSGQSSEPTPSPYWQRWFVYAAPVAAMAVLILMLLPNRSPQAPYAPVPVSPEAGTSLPEDVADAPAARMMAPVMEDAPLETFSMMAAPADSFALGTVLPGLTIPIELVDVSAPSFLVVRLPPIPGQIDDSTPVLGVSPLLLPGDLSPRAITLTEPLRPGLTYTLTLYRDNGDGTFMPGTEVVVMDVSGVAPLQQTFMVSPEGW